MRFDIECSSDGDELELKLVQGSERKYVNVRLWDDYEGRGGNVCLYAESIDYMIEALTEMQKEMN